MKAIVFLVPLVVAATGMFLLDVAAGGEPAGAAAPAQSRAFELRVGDAVYAIDLDEAFEITTPDGTKLPAVLRRQEGHYHGDGVAFSYPNDLSVERTVRASGVLLKLKSPLQFVALIQVLSGEDDPAALQSKVVADIRARLESTGVTPADVAVAPAEHEIAGAARKGTVMRYQIHGKTIRRSFTSEIYTFPLGNHVVSLLFETPDTERSNANAAFQEIEKTLTASR